MVGGGGRGQPSSKYDGILLVYNAGDRRGSGRWGSTWWYDGGGGWDDWGGRDSLDEGGVGVLSLRRASRDYIVSVSK